MIKWRFPSNDHGQINGINESGIATFRGTPLKSLAREICQNSLDAKRGDTVKIEFDMFNIPSKDIPDRDVIEDTFKKCNEFWGKQKAKSTREYFDNALKIIANDMCPVLRISDYNTTGLTGSREEINTDWTNLTKSSGASDKKGTAGGSYGIGKFAPFACSDFSMVFYSTYDQNEECAFQGVSRLVTFRRDDEETTQGVGYYGEEKNTPVFEQLILQPGYKRDQGDYGTDIYIVGYRFASEDWSKSIIISILDGFLGAIWTGKLVVFVGETEISKDSLKELIEIYKDELTGHTDKYFEVLSSEDTKWVEEDIWGLGNVKLGLSFGDPDAPRRVAMIRQTGMKIFEKDHLSGVVPFAGVMFIEGEKINERLRLIENPEHDKWQPDRSKTPVREKELLRQLYGFIRNKISEFVLEGDDREIDAIGVGNFLPDDIAETHETSKAESVSDKILEIEKQVSRKKSISEKSDGDFDANEEKETGGHKERGGDDDEWFHDKDGPVKPSPKPPEPAHVEPEGEEKLPKKKAVALEKFIPVCVNKNTGSYVLSLTTNIEGEGILSLFLSAETQNYEAPVLSAVQIPGRELTVNGNEISGIMYERGEQIRIKIDIDYYDYCSMEVKAYAIEK